MEDAQTHEWLAARFPTEESAQCNPHAAPGCVTDDQPGVLDDRYKCVFPELFRRPNWTLADLRPVATRLGLMPLALVTKLNEWTSDRYGEPVLEGGEILKVNKNLKSQLIK
jgi:TerB-C domain